MAEFGEYTVCEVAAATNRFVVYRATDRIARSVFIKVTRAGASLDDLSALSSDFALAQTLLDSPGIPRALRIGSTDAGQLFQVREDVPGASLEQRLLDATPSVIEALLLTLRILRALRALHDRGLAHCDLKPANLLYDAQAGVIHIIDMSMARPFGSPGRPDRSIGPHHAPEQTVEGGVVDARTDYFALGVILRQLLAAEPSGGGGQLSRDARDAVGGQLGALADRLTAADPSARYATRLGIERDLARCIREWRANGAIARFPLGEFDEGDGLVFPREPIGLHLVRSALRERFWAASDGTSGIVLLAGAAGSGKSTVLADLRKNVELAGAVVAAGGWSELDQDVPFRGLSAVSRRLVAWWQGLEPSELDERRAQLARVLASNAGVITEAFPELEALLGVHPAPLPVGNVERQHRLIYWFAQFLSVIGRSGRPLVLLLEDLHWADGSSLRMLERLATHAESRFLLVVGTYRTAPRASGEGSEAEDFERLTALDSGIEALALPAFQAADTEAFLETALEVSDCAPLAAVLNRMSLGNPLMLRELVASLVSKEVISFDAEQDAWRWRLDRVEASGLSDDVAIVLSDRLAGLASEAHQTLSVAACVGRQFDAGTVASLMHRERTAVRDALEICERAGFITRGSPAEAEIDDVNGPVFSFRHDRVQQACYRGLPHELQQKHHAALGAALLARYRAGSRNDTWPLFESLAHLNRSRALGERSGDTTLVRLNVEAAVEAKATTAYATAARLLRVAVNLLPPDPWHAAPDLTLEVFVLRAECEYLSGDDARAQDLYRELFEHISDPQQRAAVLLTRMKMFAHAGRFPEAIEDGLACLDALGIRFPATPRLRHLMGPLLRVLVLARPRAGRGDTRPAVLDERTDMIMTCLAELWGPAFWVDDNLTGLVIFTMVRLSQRHGNAAASSIAYASYGAFLAGALGMTNAGKQTCRFGVQIASDFSDPVYQGRSQFMYTGFFAHHEQSLPEHLEAFRALVTASRQCGDYPYAGAASLMFLYVLALGGRPMSEVLSEADKIRDIARQTGHDRTMIALEMVQRWVAILDGRAQYAAARFKVDIFAPGRAYENERGAFYLFELTLLFLLEDYQAAEAQLALLVGNKLVTGYFRVYHAFMAALLLAKLGPRSSAGPGWRRRLRAHCRLVEREAEVAPQNYAHKALLLRAIVASHDGRHAAASALFEEAVNKARAHAFDHHAAIAAELAADHHRPTNTAAAKRHILNARLWYQQWGCLPKIGAIDRRYSDLLMQREPVRSTEPAPTSWPSDLDAVIAASRALSEEADAGRLVDRLLSSIIEHTSASRAVLLLRVDGELKVDRDRRAGPFLPAENGHADGEDGVPRLVVSYVDRLRSPVLLSRASDDELFRRDPYFAAHPTASILCISLARMNESLGVLFLEKESGATFRHSDLVTAEILGAQAAVTLNSVRERDERLAALQTQMNPHFLFNALNSVAELSVSNPSAVERAILRLSGLYRTVLDTSRRRAVALKTELDLVDSYLALEKLRFGGRLTYQIDTDGDVADAIVPPLLIQPLVENGVNHGIAWNGNGGAVRVQATVRDQRVHVRVTDTGGTEAILGSSSGLGMGLPTIRRRLELFFGRDTELVVTRNSGVVVDMYFPRRPLTGDN